MKDADSQTEKSMLERSKNKAIDVEDSANYSEDFQVTPPETTTDDAGQSYRFVMVKDNKQLTGTYNHEEDQVIDLLYIRNDRGAIIVDHVDEKGNPLKDREYRFDTLDAVYATAKDEFPTWYFKEVSNTSDPVEGTYKQNVQHIVYVYTKTPPPEPPQPPAENPQPPAEGPQPPEDNPQPPAGDKVPPVTEQTPPVVGEKPEAKTPLRLPETGVHVNVGLLLGTLLLGGVLVRRSRR